MCITPFETCFSAEGDKHFNASGFTDPRGTNDQGVLPFLHKDEGRCSYLSAHCCYGFAEIGGLRGLPGAAATSAAVPGASGAAARARRDAFL